MAAGGAWAVGHGCGPDVSGPGVGSVVVGFGVPRVAGVFGVVLVLVAGRVGQVAGLGGGGVGHAHAGAPGRGDVGVGGHLGRVAELPRRAVDAERNPVDLP